MLLDLVMYFVPFEVRPSSLFCDINVGQLFRSDNIVYKLIYRDSLKVRIVRWNWFTSIFWGGNTSNGYGSKVTN